MEKVSILCTALCVGVLVGGCSVRNEYNPSAVLPVIDYLAEKPTGVVSRLDYTGTTFNGYVVDCTFVDGYEYNVKDKTLTIHGIEYTYVGIEPTEVEEGGLIDNNKSKKNYVVGNFDSSVEDGQCLSRVQVMVDRDTEEITVVGAREFLDYFVNGNIYDDYEFFSNSSFSGIRGAGGFHLYVKEECVSTEFGVGFFGDSSVDGVTATIDSAGNIKL